MYLRAFIAFLALPGVVAGIIPALIVHAEGDHLSGWTFGFVLLGLGFVLLLWCIRDFFVAGRGTLAPWDPPKHLVIVGLYRIVRNPMYIAVVTMVFGWSMIAGSRLLGLWRVVGGWFPSARGYFRGALAASAVRCRMVRVFRIRGSMASSAESLEI